MTFPALPAGALAALGLVAPAPTAAATDDPRALSLIVEERDGMIEVQLIGLAPEARGVSYSLEVTGRSTARHRGATTLASGTRAVLSTLRTAAGEDWCVRLTAEEDGRDPYAIMRGPCAAGG